jgi:electron transfer flavoprotein alpha subunit
VSVLVVAEHQRGQVREVTRELVTAASELGSRVTVALIASDPVSLAGQVNVAGVDEIVTVSVPQDEFEPDVYCNALEAVITRLAPEVVLMPFSVNAMSCGPALAAKLGLGFASDVFAARREAGGLVATRAFYGGKVFADLVFEQERTLLLLRPGTWAAATEPGDAEVSSCDIAVARSRVRHLEFRDAPSGDVDMAAADLLLAIGRGIGEQEHVEPLARLAEKMGAVLCGSRPLVDAGWLPSERQVGQSGRTVKPKVYVALGVSGAVQHLAGMKSAGTIIAVNRDSEASIFNVAHYGAVADLFEVAEALEELY